MAISMKWLMIGLQRLQPASTEHELPPSRRGEGQRTDEAPVNPEHTSSARAIRSGRHRGIDPLTLQTEPGGPGVGLLRALEDDADWLQTQPAQGVECRELSASASPATVQHTEPCPVTPPSPSRPIAAPNAASWSTASPGAAAPDAVDAPEILDALESDTGSLLAGRYRLVQRVHTGRMSTVWLAADESPHAPDDSIQVAVKLIPTEVASGHDDATWARLIRASAHPALLTLLDYGTAGERTYQVSAWTDGPTLESLLREHAEDTLARQIPVWVAQLANALDALHRIGIVHGDVKPDNVLITHNGACLIDLCGVRMGQPWSSRFGLTRAYASPEALRGAPADPRDDVYSMGVLTFLLLGGHLPRTPDAGSPAEPARPPDIAPAQWDALRQALDPDRSRRPRSVADLPALLWPVASHPVPRPSAVPWVARRHRRRRVPRLTAAALAAAMVVGIAAQQVNWRPVTTTAEVTAPLPAETVVATPPPATTSPRTLQAIDTFRTADADRSVPGEHPLAAALDMATAPARVAPTDPSAAAEPDARPASVATVATGDIVTAPDAGLAPGETATQDATPAELQVQARADSEPESDAETVSGEPGMTVFAARPNGLGIVPVREVVFSLSALIDALQAALEETDNTDEAPEQTLRIALLSTAEAASGANPARQLAIANPPQPILAPEPTVIRPEPLDRPSPPVADRPQPIDRPAPPVADRPQPIDRPAPPVADRPQPIDRPAPPVADRPQPIDRPAPPVANRPEPINRPAPPVANRPEPINRPAPPAGRPAVANRPAPPAINRPAPPPRPTPPNRPDRPNPPRP